MNVKNELLLRLYIVILGFFMASAAIVYKLVQVNVLEGQEWRSKGDSMYRKFMPIEAERGSILANDLRPFAVSQPFFEIRVDLYTSAKKDFEKHVDSLAYYLVHDLGLNKEPSEVAAVLRAERAEKNRYFLISRDVSYDQLERLKRYPLFRLGKYRGGLIIEERTKRQKPYHMLASRTIGLDRQSGTPVGIEGSFDSYLSGDEGKRLMQKIDGSTWIPVNNLSEIAPKRGNDVVTTLDVDLQDIVHNALLQAIKKHEAEFGTAILMDVKSGAIKAMSNISKTTQSGYWETYNYAVGMKIEPGSTFKAASVLALFEDEAADLDTWVNLHKGRENFYGLWMEDSHRHGIEGSNLKNAFEISSNVGIATLVDRYYNNKRNAELFIDRLNQFGLRQPTQIDILGEPDPFIKDAFDYKNLWSKTSIPWMAHGYELQITPLQMLAFYNTIANDGKRMKPYLVQEIKSGEKIIKRFEPQVVSHAIAKRSSIEKMKILLHGVVETGTGKSLKSDLISIAMKTGTAKIDYFKKDVTAKYLSSVAGYFPSDAPQYSCIVLIGKPERRGYYGGAVAGPVFKEIAEQCFLTKIGPERIVNQGPVPKLADQKLPASDVGYKNDMIALLNELKVEFTNSSEGDWVVLRPEKQKVHLQMRKTDAYLVPNVKGMGAKDAIYLLEQSGLDVEMTGHGKVMEQSIKPGERLVPKQKIRIRMG